MSVFLVLAMAGAASALKLSSPCPELFHYDSADEPNQWTGTLTLLSDAELYGVWLRLIFDEKLTELHVGDNFGEVATSDNQQFLIKNNDFQLKADTPVGVKITAKYNGSAIPTLTSFRLNAKTVCSSQESEHRSHFPGDLNARDFLTSVAIPQTFPTFEVEGCGIAPLGQGAQYPWQGSIRTRLNDSDNYVCEATLISSNQVLTPAHCVTYLHSQISLPPNQLKIYLGSKQVQEFGAAEIYLNPGYRARGLLNDLAVIQLDKPAIINDYVRPICLRQTTDKRQGSLVGYEISGGKMKEFGEAKVEIIGDEECLKQSAELKGLLSDGVFCGKYVEVGDNSSCVGDSGSSLVSLRAGSKPIWELKGIVTVGVFLQDKIACDHDSTIVLVEVARHIKWIQSVLS